MKKSFIVASLLAFSNLAWSAGDVPQAVTDGLAKLQELSPGMQTSDISKGPVQGTYQFVAQDRILYITDDGRYLLSGQIIDLDKKLNLTAVKQEELDSVMRAKQGQQALKLFDELGAENMIVFEASDAQHTMTVFTDIECPYCVKFHNDVPKLNEAGITVRYLMYPRAGIDSPSYQTSVSVWCADDRNKTLGLAKNREPVEQKTCENPVEQHYAIGNEIGLRGTPMLVLDDGMVLPGYLPPDKIVAAFKK